MRKSLFYIIILFFSIFVYGCNTLEEADDTDYHCKLTPLSDGCLELGEGPEYDDSIHYGEELVFNETFSDDFVDGQPFSWLLYRSDTYKLGAVEAKIKEDENQNKYVSLYSNGVHSPLYNPVDRSLIFTRQFNLDEVGYGIAEADIYLPNSINNEIHFEVTTGSVNVIGINIKQNGKVSVISGGVYHNYQGTLDITNTNITLDFDTWYRLRLEWNRELETVKASLYDNNTDDLIVLYDGKFHISVRVNNKKDGTPLVPNVVRFSMPKSLTYNGYVYIDNIVVDKQIENGDSL